MRSNLFLSILILLGASLTAIGQIKQPGQTDPKPDPVEPGNKACEIQVHTDYKQWRVVLVGQNGNQVLGQTFSSVYDGSNAEGFNAILDAAKKLVDMGICTSLTFKSGF